MQRTAIIIVTWNSAHLIKRVLDALAAQTAKADRILVIDNHSDDAEKLSSIVEQFQQCELVLFESNVGFAAANNFAIHRCIDMNFVALLNPDAFPESGWLAALLSCAAAHPETASFASRLLNAADPSIMDGAGDYLTITGKPGRRGHGAKAKPLFLKQEEIFGPCAAAALYRTDALRTAGGFDERFFCYVEDVDLAFRLQLLGYESRYVPEAVALHIGSAVTGRRSEFAIYHGQRNLIFNYVKNMPPFLFWGFLIPHILLNITYLFGATIIGQGRVTWRAKRDAVANIGEVLKQRARIQETRRISTLKILKILKFRMW